ncbi:MAG: isoprenylcysteine carboxylmethyltransferase family protein [Acidobacteriota bacterium]|nr:isoprenylcysteine carboxylmethyltransferase family protein [Acidobacteriota bacterium]
MRATAFEFRYRFFVIAAIYAIGFSCYAIDRVNAGVAIAQWISAGPLQAGSPHTRLVLQSIFGIGALLAIAAAAVRTWAAAYLKSDVVHDLHLHSDALVADGPFRYVRNPLYVGGLLLSAGMGLMASRLGWIVLNVLSLWFYLRLILREEAQLLESQGASYAAYCRAVPRLWPALRPRVPSSGTPPRWGQAFLGEAFLWAFAAAVIIFAVTLSEQVALRLIDVVLLLYVVRFFVFRRRPKAS